MVGDARVYVLDTANFAPKVQIDGETRLCCRAEDGQDWFHRLATGEVYLSDGERDFCLNCAVAQGLATRTRPSLGNGSSES